MRHWCFIAEITADASIFRPVFLVRDRDGKETRIALYLDDTSLYDPRNYKVGNTICVMYAFKKQFADGTSGVRVEDGNRIQSTTFIS